MSDCKPNTRIAVVYVIIAQISNLSLIIVTSLTMYFLYKKPSARSKPPMVIICNLLVSDSMVVLFANQLRTYLEYCNASTFIKCTICVLIARTLGFVSMCMLMLFGFERLAKVAFSYPKYLLWFNNKMLNLTIALIWTLCISVGALATTNWKVIVTKNVVNMKLNECAYSSVTSPITGLISTIFFQMVPVSILAGICIKFVIDIRKKLLEIDSPIQMSDEQRKRNQELIKRVEINIFLTALCLCGSNIVFIFPICVLDIIGYMKMLGAVKGDIPTWVFNLFIFFAMMYPMAEALTCFFLNYRLWKFWSNIVMKIARPVSMRLTTISAVELTTLCLTRYSICHTLQDPTPTR